MDDFQKRLSVQTTRLDSSPVQSSQVQRTIEEDIVARKPGACCVLAIKIMYGKLKFHAKLFTTEFTNPSETAIELCVGADFLIHLLLFVLYKYVSSLKYI